MNVRLLSGLLGFLTVLALPVVSGCKNKSETRDAAGGATSQILRYGNYAEPQDLDPQVVQGIPELHLMQALFEGLLDEDPQDLHPIPGVAKSWDISTDGLLYTFHLRNDAKWSNGDSIIADDFVQSYKRMLTPSLGSEYSYLLWFVVGAEDYNKGRIADFTQVGFKAQDAATLVVKLRSPTPFLLNIIANHYAWHPVPIKVIAKFGGLDRKSSPWTRPENFVSNGPFTLKKWVPHQQIVVEKSHTYWDKTNVKLDEVDFLPIDDLDTEERMFRTGQLDRTQEIPQNKIDVYRKENPAVLHTDPWLGIYFYRFNVKHPPLDDKRVRKALALAVDRDRLVKDVTRGGEIPAYGLSYPGTAGYFPRTQLHGDIAEARRLLAEAGYPNGKGFPSTEVIYNTQQNHRLIAEALQQMWKKNLGIDITLVNQEWKIYLDNQHTHNFQMQRAGWIADYVDPNVFLEIWTTGNLNNDSNWGNPEYDRLAAAALNAQSEMQRYDHYQKMDAILVDELPVIPLFFYTRANLVSTRLKGYYPTLLDNHPFKGMYLEGPK